MKIEVSEDPKDCFDPCTVPVDEWLSCKTSNYEEDTSISRWNSFLAACGCVARQEFWDGSLRQAPRVGYDWDRDEAFFIFKIDNNGTTWRVYMSEE